MRSFSLVLTLVACGLLFAACNDDDPVRPEAFSAVIKVVDTAGDPVEGLRVHLVNDTPYFQDGRAAEKAAVAMQFLIPKEVTVRVSIHDVEGGEIKLLVNEHLVAGRHQIIWNGTDKEGVHQPSGRYTARMKAYELGTDKLLFQDSEDMLLAMLDASRVPAGYTDEDGKLKLRDKKLFPHLYDRPDMEARNENAEIIGKLVLTPLMRISLGDGTGRGMWFKEEIINGTVLNLVWDPPSAATVKPLQGAGPAVKADIIVPPVDFDFGPIYPNPFN